MPVPQACDPGGDIYSLSVLNAGKGERAITIRGEKTKPTVLDPGVNHRIEPAVPLIARLEAFVGVLIKFGAKRVD
jgi:hypothetical protein